MKRPILRKISTVTAVFILVSACTVGPDFIKPAAPEVKDYTATPLPEKIGEKSRKQQFYNDKDVPADWWKLYKSPALDALVEQALKANPTLQSAQASLRQAKENYYASKGTLFPSVDLNPYVSRETDAGAATGIPNTPSTTYSIYNTTVNVSYGLDLFGLNRRNIEALKANADNKRFNATATYITLTTNVVAAAIQEASLIAQVTETEHTLKLQRKQLELTRAKFEAGAIDKTAVLAQESNIAQTEASLPILRQQQAKAHNQLAVLVGRFPGEKLGDPLDLKTVHLPEDIPVSLPSKLVEQRPDIKAAESLLHNASASIGIATANMLPQLSLTGSYGRQENYTSDFFSPSAVTWNIQASLLQPLFRGGQLLHQRKAAIANYDNAAAAYKNVVLTAFQNVADSLNALQFDAEAAEAAARAEEAARANLELAQVQFKTGAAHYLTLLDAERQYTQAKLKRIQTEAARYADTAALFQALGGGWWNQEHTTQKDTTQDKEEEKKKND